jgi:hypothetical protein
MFPKTKTKCFCRQSVSIENPAIEQHAARRTATFNVGRHVIWNLIYATSTKEAACSQTAAQTSRAFAFHRVSDDPAEKTVSRDWWWLARAAFSPLSRKDNCSRRY